MIYSEKTSTVGHKLRHKIAKEFPQVDLYGRGSPAPINLKEEALVDYRFSIVIENSRIDNYFTEKLVDCFLTGTVPIYWGCPNIGDYFEEGGVISLITVDLFSLTGGLYEKMMPHINKNFALAKC